MMQDAKTIIPDTNILLHYPPIDQIDWLQWCESESVKIVFCLKVIQELDRKKDDPLLYERAKSAIKKIKELSDANGYIKDGVSGEIHTKDIEAHTSADETIIQQTLDYQSSHPEEHIYIMSEDLGMQVCCRKRIKTIEPDTTQRQKSPQSELQKENIKLRTELAKLQNQVPILSLILTQPEVDIKDTPQPFKVLYRSVDLKDEAKELADCKELESQSSLNKQPRNLSMLLINWDAYRMAILRWIKEYNEIAEQSRRNFGVDLHIQNTGGTPANNVSAIFKFPKIFQFIQCNYNHYGQIRIPPPKPEPQQYPLGIANTAIKMEPQFKMPGIGSVNGPFISFIEKDNGISLEITLAKLKHHLHRTFACQAGVISVDAAKTFEFEYEITADNMPQKVKGKIPFIFGEENQTSRP